MSGWNNWNESLFRSTVFQDEAIPGAPCVDQSPLPEPLRQARALAEQGFSRGWSRERIFVEQARLLADYEDDTVYSRPVMHYYPTYQSLHDRELRGYFGWRTRFRRGEEQTAQLTYAFLYVFELLNQIGVSDPYDGFCRLCAFRDGVEEGAASLLSYLDTWIRDYVVYYRLDPALLENTPQVRFDRALSVLMEGNGEQAERMEAFIQLSSYRIDHSRFVAQNTDLYMQAAQEVLTRVERYYEKHRKISMVQDFFGRKYEGFTELFRSAVLWQDPSRPAFDYKLDPLCTYHWKNGWCVVERYHVNSRSKKLGDVLKTVDGALRELTGFKPTLKPVTSAKWLLRLVDEVCAETIQRQKERERLAEQQRLRTQIDLSALAHIRSDAAQTRERLMTDEERAQPEESMIPSAALASVENNLGLTAPEYRLLHCLLYGGDTDWVTAEGQMVSVLADSINEKLYDTFADAVLDETPAPVEDYLDELREMIHP